MSEAEGAVLAHSRRAGERLFRKGRVLTAEDLALLREAGFETVVAAQLDADDIAENKAAGLIAAGAAGNARSVGGGEGVPLSRQFISSTTAMRMASAPRTPAAHSRARCAGENMLRLGATGVRWLPTGGRGRAIVGGRGTT